MVVALDAGGGGAGTGAGGALLVVAVGWTREPCAGGARQSARSRREHAMGAVGAGWRRWGAMRSGVGEPSNGEALKTQE